MIQARNSLAVATTVLTVVSAFRLDVPSGQAILIGLIGGAFVDVCGHPEIRRQLFGSVNDSTKIRSQGVFAVVLVSLAGLTTTDSVPFYVAVAGLLATLTAFGVGVRTGRSVDERD